VGWTFLHRRRGVPPRGGAAATAIVVGLVAITPAAGFISPMNAIFLGAIAAVPSYLGLVIRAKTNLDDSLDVVAAHGVGGTVGAILTGVFAEKSINGVFDGLIAGNPAQVLIQAAAVGTAIVYSGVMSFVLLKLIGLFMPLRATSGDEASGLDVTQHGEEAYLHAESQGAAMMSATEGVSAQPMLQPARTEV
jgi:Amt family ammonium transporter